RRHTRSKRDWSSDVCSSDLNEPLAVTTASTWMPSPIVTHAVRNSYQSCISNDSQKRRQHGPMPLRRNHDLKPRLAQTNSNWSHRSEERRVGKGVGFWGRSV